MLTYGISAPIAGALGNRLGPKKTMGLGAVLLALGAATSSLGWQLVYLWGPEGMTLELVQAPK
ncbi:MAG: hypothetical protein QF906_03875 [Dehalococcoidales bacterium]|nr:hypothetical protein [Dehalococcoidales bacterium]MDP7415966.1 hypothetical protein [Dehalococcoidales bacterium]